jgi:hypothetical protein
MKMVPSKTTLYVPTALVRRDRRDEYLQLRRRLLQMIWDQESKRAQRQASVR